MAPAMTVVVPASTPPSSSRVPPLLTVVSLEMAPETTPKVMPLLTTKPLKVCPNRSLGRADSSVVLRQALHR